MYKIPTSTLFLGKNLVSLPECPSTNTLALELAQQGRAPEGTVVVTRHQTAGRGQRGNTWVVGKDLNLTLSVVLSPEFLTVGRQFELNKCVSLAVFDVISKHVSPAPACIKWPNDILVGDLKVSGILIENTIAGTRITRSVVGIGLNVNQREFEFPHATSLARITGKEFSLPQVFEQLLLSLEWRYLALRRGDMAALHSDYMNVLYRRGHRHLYASGGRSFEGIILGVNDEGKLDVEVDGRVASFDLKEIKYLS